MVGCARHISDQSAAMTSFLRPVFLTASTMRASSQELMKLRSIGCWSGKTAWICLKISPPRFEAMVVRIVGTPNAFAVLARAVTLLITNVGSWLLTLANWDGW